MLLVAKSDEVDTRQVNPFLNGAYVTEYANVIGIVSLFLKPSENFLPFLETCFTRNRPDTSITLLELSHRGLAVSVNGDVLIIHEDALSVMVASEAKDVPKLSLFLGLIRLLVCDKAERVVRDNPVLHSVSKAVLKDQPSNKSPTFFRHRQVIIILVVTGLGVIIIRPGVIAWFDEHRQRARFPWSRRKEKPPDILKILEQVNDSRCTYMMGLIKERKRQSIEVSAQFMERLVGDHGNATVIREVLFYFCRSFRLLCCEHEGIGCVMRDKLLYEVERRKD
jgi:hypothetical protein